MLIDPPAAVTLRALRRRLQGFSSSLVRPTPDDLSDPVLPEGTEITGVDRVRAPYNHAGDQVSSTCSTMDAAADRQ